MEAIGEVQSDRFAAEPRCGFDGQGGGVRGRKITKVDVALIQKTLDDLQAGFDRNVEFFRAAERHRCLPYGDGGSERAFCADDGTGATRRFGLLAEDSDDGRGVDEHRYPTDSSS